MNPRRFLTATSQPGLPDRPRPRLRAARPLCGLVSLALLSGAASAQTGQPDLGAYRSMAAALDQAIVDRQTKANTASSLSDLDRAAAAYLTLKPTLSSSLLTSGVDTTLQSARAALGRAPADLEAQVVQARSMLRRALSDQSLGQLGRSAVSPAQSGLLATEFGLSGADRTRFLADMTARDGASAARLLRRSAAQKVQANLSGVQVPQNAGQRTGTYLGLARATGWFSVVQDAPDTGGLKLSQFTQALTQLTGGDNAALGGSLSGLKRGSVAFVAATVQAVKSGVSAPATPPANTGTATIPATPTPAVPATPGPASPTPVVPATPTSTPAATLSPAARQQAALNATYAALGRAQSAAGHANLPEARTQLDLAAQNLPGSGLSSTDGYDAALLDLSSLQGRTGLRPGDVQAMIAELGSLENRANAAPTSALDSASAAVTHLPPPLWALLFLIVGLLAIYPLYLLNLAFGGRNSYWKAIAASLLLLFLPVMLEGVGGVLGYLGDLTGVGALRALGNLSLHQGAWGLPIWLLLAAAAVGLASYGFRGLCRQFGLLGGSSGSSANPTRIEPTQTALDWDEEL